MFFLPCEDCHELWKHFCQANAASVSVNYVFLHHPPTHTHTCTYTYTHAHMCTHMYIHIHACTHMHTQAYTHRNTHAHLCTHTRMCMHTHTQTHIHKHTNKHTFSYHLYYVYAYFMFSADKGCTYTFQWTTSLACPEQFDKYA